MCVVWIAGLAYAFACAVCPFMNHQIGQTLVASTHMHPCPPIPPSPSSLFPSFPTQLGAPVNTSLITAEESVRALLREELKGRPSLKKRMAAWWNYYKVRGEGRAAGLSLSLS